MDPRVEYRKNAQTIDMVQEMIDCFRRQNFNRGDRLLPVWTKKFTVLIGTLMEEKAYFNESQVIVNETEIVSILRGVMEAQEQKDYILMADYLELQVLPFLFMLQDVIREKEEAPFPGDFFEKNYDRFIKDFFLQKKKEHENIFYINLTHLFEDINRIFLSMDNIHYTDIGMYRVANKIVEYLKGSNI